jgi:hypothetical protein
MTFMMSLRHQYILTFCFKEVIIYILGKQTIGKTYEKANLRIRRQLQK